MRPAFVLAIAMTGQVMAQHAPPPDRAYPPARMAVVTTFVDGVTRYDLVSEKPASMWTPQFPHVPASMLPPGSVAYRALNIWRQAVDDRVHVKVSLLSGPLMHDEQPVRELMIARGERVRVSELRAFGVEPIVLSLADTEPMTPFLPTVISVAPELEISAVELLSAPYPGYRVRVRNVSTRTVATFHVQSYHGADKAMSAVKAGTHGLPAMAPGGSYSFDMNLTSGRRVGDGPVSPRPVDIIHIDGVVWADGESLGANNGASVAIPSDAGQRLMLERALAALRSAEHEPATAAVLLDHVRHAFEALSIDGNRLPATQNAMRATRMAILNDLNFFAGDRSLAHDTETVKRWIAATIQRYEAWMKLLSPV